MARTKSPRYLMKRYRTWYVAFDIPADVREEFGGQPRFVRTLKTESETVAERSAKPIIAKLQERVAKIREAQKDPFYKVRFLTEEWRQDMLNAKGEEYYTLNSALEDHIEALKLDEIETEIMADIIRGKIVRLADHVDDWSASLRDQEPKTIDMKRSDAQRFAAALPYSHQVTRKSLANWVHTLQEEENLSSPTVRRILSACKGFWDYLDRRELVEIGEEVFFKVAPKKQTRNKAHIAKERRPFSKGEVLDLLERSKDKGDQQLANLIWIGMWTGCRIEEICSLKTTNLEDDFFNIEDAKTKAGWRNVPIHPDLKPKLRELADASKSGYVLDGLTENKYGNRSNAVGKRFGRLKKAAGYDATKVFHSIRRTVATQLEQAGIPENVSADILGHDKKTMTYGVYSGGSSREDRMDAISKLSYKPQNA